MLDLNDIALFVQVAKAGSFAEAAVDLVGGSQSPGGKVRVAARGQAAGAQADGLALGHKPGTHRRQPRLTGGARRAADAGLIRNHGITPTIFGAIERLVRE